MGGARGGYGAVAVVGLGPRDDYTPEVLRRDFRNSLFAAYTVAEVQSQVEAAGLGGLHVAAVSDRHLAVRGQLPG